MKNIVIIVLLILVIGAGAWYFIAQPGSDTTIDGTAAGANTAEVVATVNGEEIGSDDLATLEAQVAVSQGVTLESLDEATRAQLRTQALDTLIGQALLRQEIQASGATISEEELATEMAEIKARFTTEEEYQAALTAENLNETSLRERVGVELITQAHLEEELQLATVTASDAEIQTAYAEIDAQGQVLPALEEIRADVEAFVIQQKQQALLDAYIQELRAAADVEVLL